MCCCPLRVLPCRHCGSKAGYQPFGGASSVSFAMKDEGHPGQAPPVHLQLTNPDTKKACNAQVQACCTVAGTCADGLCVSTD